MANDMTRLVLHVEDGHSDQEELAQLTDALRRELLDLDVGPVQPVSDGPAPPDSRALDIAALGTLVVTLAKSELLAAIVNAVAAWLRGRERRTVKMEVDGDVLELTGLPSQERRRLTEEWLRRRVPDRAFPTGVRSALIIASRAYQDPGLRQLRAPAHDAEALARVLGDATIGGFDVRTLLDAPSYEICEAVEAFFADRGPDDLLLMHFSGHGVKDDSGQLHFATSNTKLSRLGATSVEAAFVNRLMGRSRSRRIVLLLDCCYAGAFERGMTARAGTSVNIEEQFGGRGRAVITASSAMEYAFEGDQLTDTHELAPSVFTSAIVEGLDTGDADRDQDGQVSLDELYDYVYDRVRVTAPNQTPGKWTFGVHGDIYVARRARPVTTPTPLPGELQQAVDHPIVGIRQGAVAELARLVQARHAGLALAARLALQRLVNDDSRSVSAAATEALAATAKQDTDSPPLQAGVIQPAVPPRAAPPAAETTHRQATAAQAQPPAPPTSTHHTEGRADRTPRTEEAVPPGRPAAPIQGRPGAAGVITIVGAILLILSLFLPLTRDISSNTLLAYPWLVRYVVVLGVVLTASGLLAILPRTRGLAATGILTGATAVSTSGLVYTAYYLLYAPSFTVFRAGQWLNLLAHLTFVAAGVLAFSTLDRAPEVRAAFRRRPRLAPNLVLALGLANTAALVTLWSNAHRTDTEASRFPYLWTAAVSLVVCVCAAVVSPNRLGAALLGGWVVASAALYLSFIDDPVLHYDTNNDLGIYLYGASLLALLLAAVALARSQPGNSEPQPAP